jgi:hypothetical protein
LRRRASRRLDLLRPARGTAAGLLLSLAFAAAPPGLAAPQRAAWEARRLTPEGHDAIRPAFSRDGRRIAYVHLPAGSAAPSSPSAPRGLSSSPRLSSTRGEGGEIWEIDLPGGARRRRIGAEDLARAGLDAPGYQLLDLAWSGDGRRLAFTWLDGVSWGEVAVSDPNGRVVRLPSPSVPDPWEGGARFQLASARFLWSADGSSGTLVGWDDDCGSLFHSRIPPEGRPRPVPLPPGCRSFLLPAPGLWLYTDFDEEFARRLTIIDEAGRPVESVTFPQGHPLHVRWGSAPGRGRPAVIGWWLDTERELRILFVWREEGLVAWRREPCVDPCAVAVAMMRGGEAAYLAGAPGAARLMILPAPGSHPEEILEAGVDEILAAPDGRSLLAVRVENGARSLWLLVPPSGAMIDAGPGSGRDLPQFADSKSFHLPPSK